ncbi:MAG: amidohydrolase/deacetylase family metallohydrolase [Dehalococcoidales bacterium]|jgi:dihydroorotase|nr:amidohydrolase/deacetylase family metallohydrolase [Dehalococcoidales bacterium]MDP6577083.1 amidohydrolase/deacetylase family metallohydrolase [Dehalococcoidales bacterium]MDP6824953.1 amidohydrolase/deacetylase family metallohydrolase [Dehalococcoidales bacterium]
MRYDLLIKGGRVIDPAQNIDDKRDIAISGDKISAVARDIPSLESQQIIDASDKIVTPGLIDMHCHVYHGGTKGGVNPDAAGVRQGVTTLVDAGSAGEATFGGLPKYVIPSARTTVFCFLHLGSQGLTVVPELRDREEINLEATAETIEANLDLIKGIKLRLVGNVVTSDGVEVVKMAKQTAKKFGLPVMVHIGDVKKQISPTLTQEFLPLMEPGDILSHVYTAQMGSILRPDDTIMPELREAMERGVILDVAEACNFSSEVARKALAQDIFPTTLSTDVGLPSITGPVYGLTVTMSRFLALGLDMKQLVEKTTINPARALRIDNSKGNLKPGMDADVSVLELRSGTWELVDAEQQVTETDTLLAPSITVKSGQLIPAKPVAQPKPIN